MPPKNQNNGELKAGSAAPLNGALGNEVAGLLGMAAQVATMSLVYDATLRAGLAVDQVLGVRAPSAAPQMAATPNPYQMKMPTLEMGKPR